MSMSGLKYTPEEHGLAALKAVLNLLPMGGAISSLLSDYVPSSTQRNMERSVELFGDRLATLAERIDATAVNKDEFSELFRSCSSIFARTHQEEKLRAAANLLANLLLRPCDSAKVSYQELDHLIRCVDALSIGAITTLGAAKHIALSNPLGGQKGHFNFDQLHRAMYPMDAALLMGLISELRSTNLLHIQEPAIRMPDYGNYLLELTPLGWRFAERFIEGEM
jgi:hypothetical protein